MLHLWYPPVTFLSLLLSDTLRICWTTVSAPWERRCFRTANVTAWPVNNLREPSSTPPPPAPPGPGSCRHMDRMPALYAVHWEKFKHVAWGSPDDCLGMMISTICSGCLRLPETPRCMLLLAIRGIPNETSAAVQLSVNIRWVWIIFPPRGEGDALCLTL